MRAICHTWIVGLVVLLIPAAVGAESSAELPEVPEEARADGAVDGDDPRVEARLLVDRAEVEPGESFRVGVHLKMDPKWHVYWRNSGSAGMPTTVEWSGPLEFGPLQWPAPHVYTQSDGEITTFGYADQVLLFSRATTPDDASGSVRVEADLDYLACKVDCIPGGGELVRRVPVAEEGAPAGEREAGLFGTFEERVPKQPGELGVSAEVAYSQEPVRPGDTFRAGIGLDFCADGPNECRTWKVAGEVDDHRFIPDSTSQVEWSTTGVRRHPSAKKGVVVVLEGRASPNPPEEGERLSGVIWLKDGSGETVPIKVGAALPRGEEGASVAQNEPALLAVAEELSADDVNSRSDGAEESTVAAPAERESGGATAKKADDRSRGGGQPVGFWQALLFAILGGMILNLMPCVFPVLALKVTSFAELVHEDRSHAVLHGAAYTAGIVGSMLALAGVVLGLRVAGTEVGWGFQFQNPAFPAVLSAAVVLFAMNLFGIFEFHVQASSLAETTREASGLRRSVGEGILAVVLATPCSAPFLGTAMGFALTGSALSVIVMFTALGVGLALPFVVLMLVPGWSELLPDPGPWMVQIRTVLGFVLLGAAVWLVWIAGRIVGVDGMAQVLALLAVVGFTGWIAGAVQEGDWNPLGAVLGAGYAGLVWAGWQWGTMVAAVGTTAHYVLVAGLVVAGVATLAVLRRSVPRFAGGALGAALVATIAAGNWALDFDRAKAAPAEKQASASQAASGELEWRSWSDTRVDEALEQGRPVFVDFTADWCITCKANERGALSSGQVRESFRARDVALFKADWTDGDPTIRKKLESFGRSGVPMYLMYSPESPDEPEVLPQVLTPDIVTSAVEEAAE